MDNWRVQQQRMSMNGIGPMRSRPSPYQINEIKQTYQYPSITVKTDSNSNVYSPLPYTPNHMEQIQNQQRLISNKNHIGGPISTYNSEHHHSHLMSARTRSFPYPSPSMYNHCSGSICQCNQHMHYPSQHPVYYQNYYSSQIQTYPLNSNTNKTELMKMKTKSVNDEYLQSSTSYHPSIGSNSYIPAQQLPPQTLTLSQEYQTFSNQSQIFPSPSSNPSTPYQGEFNGNTEFGVPYNQGQPSSVNSLTDALCPTGDATDGQMTPGPPSIGTPRAIQHQYSFPQTPCTPTTSRISTEHNIDELTAFLQDPMNSYLTDDLTSTIFDDIEALADTYLGGRNNEQQSNIDNKLDYDIILNYLYSDNLINTVCTN